MSQFTGAGVVEIRIYDDPKHPETSAYSVVLPMTVLEAVVETGTGNTLVQLLAALQSSIKGHAANSDIHTTAEWKTNVAQGIGAITTHVSDTDVHVTADKQTAWNSAVDDSAQALENSERNSGSISTIQGQIEQIMETLYSDVTANPWAISFDNLDGINVTHGIYNPTLQRLEC